MALLVAAMASSSCARVFGVSVSVENRSGITLQDVTISVGGRQAVWAGELKPAESRTVWFIPETGASIYFSFTAEGSTVARSYGYVSKGSRDRYKISVPPSLDPVVSVELVSSLPFG